MRIEDFDDMFDRDEAGELWQAAERLEQAATEIPPREALLVAWLLRSHAADITRAGREWRTTRTTGAALELARHINGGN